MNETSTEEDSSCRQLSPKFVAHGKCMENQLLLPPFTGWILVVKRGVRITGVFKIRN